MTKYVCEHCGIEKSADRFGKRKRKRCKDCISQDNRESYRKFRDDRLAYQKRYAADNPEKVKAYHTEYSKNYEQKRHRSTTYNSFLRTTKHYGLTQEQCSVLRQKYDRCPVCGTVFRWTEPPAPIRRGVPSVDHILPVKCRHRNVMANMAILCWTCNRIKYNCTSVELLDMVRSGMLGQAWMPYIQTVRIAEYEVLHH